VARVKNKKIKNKKKTKKEPEIDTWR